MMTALFSNGWSGMVYVIDMERGVLNRFLVTPVSRGALIGGELVYSAMLTALQSFVILGRGWLSGAMFPSVLGVILCVLSALLLVTAFASLSNALALVLHTQQSVIATSFLVLPLAFVSATFMPLQLLPAWLRAVATYNPVNWAVLVSRQALGPHPEWSYVELHLALLAGLAIVCASLSTRAFRAYQRSV